MLKRTTAVIIAALMLLSSLAACSGTSGGAENSTAAAVSETTTAEETTESQFVSDELPELDYNGATVNWIVGDYMYAFWGDFYAESETGNRINDTLYSMKNSVDERVGIDINFIQYVHDWSNMNDFIKQITSTVLAGSNDYDVVSSVMNFISQQLEASYFCNLADNAYMDFDKPWWNSTIAEAMPTDAVYFAAGDGALAAVKHTFCVFFNQDMLGSYGVTDDMYKLVEDGQWTLDKLESYAGVFYSDLDGDGAASFGDNFGLSFGDANKYLGFIFSLGVKEVTKTSTGYEVTFGNERAVSMMQRMCALVNENTGVWRALPNSDNEELIASGGGNYVTRVFLEGRSAFSCGLVQDAATIVPSVDFAYGVLPYPKWDEAQEDYVSMLQRNCYFLIPSSCTDADMSGAALEAWSSLAYRQLQPEYFEVSLKTRYSSDEGMSRTFDILRETLTFDIGEIFGSYIDIPSATFRENIRSNKSDWSSFIEKNLEKWNKALEDVYDNYK